MILYRVAQEKRNGIPRNTFMQYLILVYEVTSPEKNDTKISSLGSGVYFLGHILWDNVETQIFSLFSLT